MAIAAASSLVVVVGACGGDDGGGNDHGDERSFCRLAESVAPVAEADVESLLRAEELAPAEIREQVGVLRDLAEHLAELGEDDPEALALEFEVRFSDEYVEARHDVEAYQRAECADETTTSTTAGTRRKTGEGDEGTDG